MPANSKGPRTDILLRLPDTLVADIEAARGPQNRNEWITIACRERLIRETTLGVKPPQGWRRNPGPTIPGMDDQAPVTPEVVVPTHTHDWATDTPVYINGTMVLVSRCECGNTREETL